jgi:Tfp pilus assembly protein PilX
MKTQLRRRPRGAILIFVLVILLLLTLAAAAYFQMSSSSRATSLAVVSQQIASSHAEQGAQQAISDVRSRTVVLTSLTGRPAPVDMADCNVGNCVARATVDNGPALSPAEGGGLQWNYMIYKPQIGSAERYIIVVTGFHGYARTSLGYAESRLEVEIDIGKPSTGVASTDESSGMMGG